MSFPEWWTDSPVWGNLLDKASLTMNLRLEQEGHTGRGVLVGGPLSMACCCIQIGGVEVIDREFLDFEEAGPPMGAKPCLVGGHRYKQRRKSGGIPQVNPLGDIIYDFCGDE